MDKLPASEKSHFRKSAKFIAGFGHAFRGLWHTIRTQRNMRVHLAIALLVTIGGILLHLPSEDFAILYLAITGVLLAETFNTVIEICVDLAMPDYHPLARIAKDVAAGAVLLSAMLAIVVGLFVLGPPLWQVLGW